MPKKCVLCGLEIDDPVKLGEMKTYKKLSAHYYCLLLTSQLLQNGSDNQGILGFLPADIMKEKQRVCKQICYYCKKPSANIACCASKCLRVFHLYCGLENGALCHFKDDFRTICEKHLSSERKKCTKKDNCVICYESMGAYKRSICMLSPCCRSGWFHKWCIAKFALNAGYFFKCPLCNNKEAFRSKLVHRGIFVPDQDAAWELEPNAFAELLVRPDTCSAENCECPRGRDYQRGNYKLITCNTCGSKAIHSQCMKTPSKIYSCDACTDITQNNEADASNNGLNANSNDNDILADNEEIDVVNLNEQANANTDTESVDSLILTFVRGKDAIDDEINENISLADNSSERSQRRRQSTKRSLQSTTSDNGDVHDVDLNIIYQTTRKRRLGMRRFNSDHSTISPKRKKHSSVSKKSLSFESINKSMVDSDEEFCCEHHDSNENEINLPGFDKIAARLFADSPKSYKYSNLKSNHDFDSVSKLSTTPNPRLSTNSSTSALESAADQGTARSDISLSPESCKSKDTDCSSSGVSSLSPEYSPKGGATGVRQLPTSIIPLKDSSAISNLLFRSSRLRSRAQSTYIDRYVENNERLRSLRTRSKSIDKSLNVRRSLRLREKSTETEVYKDDVIFVSEQDGSNVRRKPLVRNLALFEDYGNCDNKLGRRSRLGDDIGGNRGTDVGNNMKG